MTRLIPGETAGTEVKDANAYDLCTPTHVVINLNHNSSLAEYKANIPDIVKTIKREYPDIIVILMSIDETGTYFPAKYPEYRASEITLGGLHSKNVSIYQYFCDELQDEANGVYVCSGHLIQPAVESYPTLDYVSADSVGRQSGRVLHMAYGRGSVGGPQLASEQLRTLRMGLSAVCVGQVYTGTTGYEVMPGISRRKEKL